MDTTLAELFKELGISMEQVVGLIIPTIGEESEEMEVAVRLQEILRVQKEKWKEEQKAEEQQKEAGN